MSRILLNTRIWLLMLLFGIVSSVYAQDDDFTTWTKFKVNHKIDSRLSVSGDVELRTKDDMNKWDRWGLTVGGDYRAYSFLKLGVAYETHLCDLGDSGWKFRHRYHLSATASFRYQWLKISLRERFQQTFDSYLMHLQKELFPLTFLLNFTKVWMMHLFGERLVCVIVRE